MWFLTLTHHEQPPTNDSIIHFGPQTHHQIDMYICINIFRMTNENQKKKPTRSMVVFNWNCTLGDNYGYLGTRWARSQSKTKNKKIISIKLRIAKRCCLIVDEQFKLTKKYCVPFDWDVMYVIEPRLPIAREFKWKPYTSSHCFHGKYWLNVCEWIFAYLYIVYRGPSRNVLWSKCLTLEEAAQNPYL